MCQRFQNFFVVNKFWLAAIAIIDSAFSIWFFIASVFALFGLREGMARIAVNGLSKAKPYIWIGPFLLLASAVTSIWNACNMWNNSEKPGYTYQLVKALVFLLIHGVVFMAPYYATEICREAVDFLLKRSNEYMLYNLMTLNLFTIILYAYEIFSCVVVWVYKKTLVERILPAENPRPKLATPHPEVIRRPETCGESKQQPVELQEPQRPTCSSRVRVDYINETNRIYENTANMAPPTRPPKRTRISQPVIPNTSVVANLTATTSKAIEAVVPGVGQEVPVNTTQTETTLNLTRRNISGNPQKYHFLKSTCLKRGLLFEDNDFPPDEDSLKIPGLVDIVWKRPYEITSKAQFYVSGMERFDVKQGAVGNCWFVAALASATTHPEVMDKVIPVDNDWNCHGGYCGLFHFRFYVASRWQEVIIDDRLPTRQNELVFIHSPHKNEFWAPLLEKAYAKLKGSYANLESGFIRTGFMNLTGGLAEEIQLDQTMQAENLYGILKSALEKDSLLGCSTVRGTRRRIRKRKALTLDQAYSITGVKRLNLGSDGKEPIIRIRNPWAKDFEWKGEFPDNHYLWDRVDKKTRLELQLIFKTDGEFWFPVKDLTDHFDLLEICNFKTKNKTTENETSLCTFQL